MGESVTQVVARVWPELVPFGPGNGADEDAAVFLGRNNPAWSVYITRHRTGEWWVRWAFGRREMQATIALAQGMDLEAAVREARHAARGLHRMTSQMTGAPGVDDGLMSLEEAATSLGMTEEAVLAAERDGQFLWGFVERLGWGFVDPGSCRFYREDVERYKAQRSAKRQEALQELAGLWADVPELTPPE